MWASYTVPLKFGYHMCHSPIITCYSRNRSRMASKSIDERLFDGSQLPLKKTKLEVEGEGGAKVVAAGDEAENRGLYICSNCDNCGLQFDDSEETGAYEDFEHL